jgi:ELWxxDGT repeat protein
LWISDGSKSGTKLFKDINSGSSASNPSGFTIFKGLLYFTADDGIHGSELWVSNGTVSGTVMFKDLNTSGGSEPFNLTVCGNQLFFNAINNKGKELWVSDGTVAGTSMVLDINPFGSSSPNWFCASGGKLYFQADDDTHGVEPWVSDGTAAGTFMLKDVKIGGGWNIDSYPFCFISYNGKVYFRATDDTHGRELWETDGTTMGTKLFQDLYPGSGDGMSPIGASGIVYNGLLYFEGNDYVHGAELWATDGTLAGTKMVKDIAALPMSSSRMDWFCIYNGKLYFDALEDNTGSELWVTDGTDTGTHIVKDIQQPYNSWPRYLTVGTDGYMYFQAQQNGLGMELYVTDGTDTGTHLLMPGPYQGTDPLNGAIFFGFSIIDSTLFFNENYDNTGKELWSVRLHHAPSGISQYPNNAVVNFSLYPNPNDGNFIIELDNQTFKKGTVSVYDLLGREVYQSQITKQQTQITLNQPKSIYLVKLQLDDAVMTKRVVVE